MCPACEAAQARTRGASIDASRLQPRQRYGRMSPHSSEKLGGDRQYTRAVQTLGDLGEQNVLDFDRKGRGKMIGRIPAEA